MASRRIHRWEMKKPTDSEKKKTKQKWEQSHTRIRISKDVHERWSKFIEENQLKTNEQAATRLLDTWYENQLRTTSNQPSTSQGNQPSTSQGNQPSTSTPHTFHAEINFPVSDISEGVPLEDIERKRIYGKFCEEVIETSIINNNAMIHITKLCGILNDMLKKENNECVYVNHRLKYHLQRDYPQLLFYASEKKNVSELVYVENLLAEGSLQSYDSLTSINVGQTEDIPQGQSY